MKRQEMLLKRKLDASGNSLLMIVCRRLQLKWKVHFTYFPFQIGEVLMYLKNS